MLRKMTPELLAETGRLFHLGVSCRQIGKRFGVSSFTVWRYYGKSIPRSLEFIICSRCGETKRNDHFPQTPRSKRVCRTCLSTKHYAEGLKKNYGLNLYDYQKMLEAQGGVCGICRTKEPANGNSRFKRFCVDHDHTNKKVRGLLCNKCNRFLGLAGDSVEVLESAVSYLRERSVASENHIEDRLADAVKGC